MSTLPESVLSTYERGPFRLPNRVVMAPMTRSRAIGNVPNALMAQYYATNKAATDDRYILLSRRISEREWFSAVELLDELGFEEGFLQEYEASSYYYRPDFTDKEKPFRDIRDFE